MWFYHIYTVGEKKKKRKRMGYNNLNCWTHISSSLLNQERTYLTLWEPFPIMDKFTMTHLVCTMHCSIFNISIHLAYRKVFFFFFFLIALKKYRKMLKTEENVLVSVRGWLVSRRREINQWLNWRYVFFVLGILRWHHWLVPLYKSDGDTALCSLALRLVDSASFLSALWRRQKIKKKIKHKKKRAFHPKTSQNLQTKAKQVLKL